MVAVWVLQSEFGRAAYPSVFVQARSRSTDGCYAAVLYAAFIRAGQWAVVRRPADQPKPEAAAGLAPFGSRSRILECILVHI